MQKGRELVYATMGLVIITREVALVCFMLKESTSIKLCYSWMI